VLLPETVFCVSAAVPPFQTTRSPLISVPVAGLPIRCFVVCSNKKNMKGYINPWAAQIPSKNWFYCWLTRVLLERITEFISNDAMKRFRSVRRVKLV
jgi:hypothetical protein